MSELPTLVHMAVCREAVIDQASNNVSLEGLVEEVLVPLEAFERAESVKTMAAGSMTVFALLSWEWPVQLEPRDIDVELRLRNPTGEFMSLGVLKAECKGMSRVRVLFKMPGFPLDGIGVYAFELCSGETMLGKAPFRAVPVKVEGGEVVRVD